MVKILIIVTLIFNFANSQRVSIGNNGIEIGDYSKLLSSITSNVRTPSAVRIPGLVSVDYAPNSRRPQSIRTPNTAVDYDSNGNVINANVGNPYASGFPYGGSGFPFNALNQAYQTVLPSVLGQILPQISNTVGQAYQSVPYNVGAFQQYPSNIGVNQRVPANNYQPVSNLGSYQQIPVNNVGFQSIPSNNFITQGVKPAPAPISRRPSFEYPGITNSLNKANLMLKTIGGQAGGGLNFPFRGIYG